MKCPMLFLLVAFSCIAQVADAQATESSKQQSDVGNAVTHVDRIPPATDSSSPRNVTADASQEFPAANGQSGLHVVSPNVIKVGGGEGLRFGPPNMGVQYGGGQGVRFGTDRFGVRYGGGEGVRYGTRNIGVQYGGSQLLRWGTPRAGVRIGGGEGARIGTRNFGIQIGTGFGLQIGRIRSAGN